MRKLYIVILVAFYTFQSANAQDIKKNYSIDSKSYIIYSANHPLHEWDGKSDSPKAIVLTNELGDIVKAAVSVGVVTFNSGNSNRDSHMLEVVESIRFPIVTFASTSIEMIDDSLKVVGNVTFHGVTKSITSKAVARANGNSTIVEGSFICKMSDYGIDPPSLMGLATDDELVIQYHIEY